MQNIFAIRASELGVANPYEQAQGIIDSISDELSAVSLKGDLFPDIENPFDISIIPNLVDQVSETITSTAPVAVAPPAGFGVGLQNTNIDPVTRLTASEEVLLDPLEKRFVKNRRTNTRLT